MAKDHVKQLISFITRIESNLIFLTNENAKEFAQLLQEIAGEDLIKLHKQNPTLLFRINRIYLIYQKAFSSTPIVNVFKNIQKFLEKVNSNPDIVEEIIPDHDQANKSHVLWESWISAKPIKNEISAYPKDSVTIKVLLGAKQKEKNILGYDTQGHAIGIIGNNDTYLSLHLLNVNNMLKEDPNKKRKGIDRIVNYFAPLYPTDNLPSTFYTVDEDDDKIGLNKRYARALEVTVDFTHTANKLFDLDAMRAKAKELKENVPPFNFFAMHGGENCTSCVVKMLDAGNIKGTWKRPSILTPLALFKSWVELASEVEKSKFTIDVEDPTHWDEVLRLFSIRLACLFPEDSQLIEFHSTIQHMVINIPNDPKQWFSFAAERLPYANIKIFIQHIQVLVQGIIQKKNISSEHIRNLISGIRTEIILYDTDVALEILHALQPVIDILRFHKNGDASRADFDNLQWELFHNFKPLVTSHHSFFPITFKTSENIDENSSLENIDFSSTNESLLATPVMDTLDSFSEIKESEIELTEQDQIDAFFILNGFDHKALTPRNISTNDSTLTPQAERANDIIRVKNIKYIAKDYLLMIRKNENISHLNKFMSLMMDGLGNNRKPSFQQMHYARKAIRESYSLEAEFQDKSPFSHEFYEKNRAVLRKYLGLTAQAIYFNDSSLYEASLNSFEMTTNMLDSDASMSIQAVLSQTVKELPGKNKSSPRAIPPLWKFWKSAVRDKFIYKDNCHKIANLIEQETLDPLSKTKKISTIINANQPSVFLFWKKDTHDQYNALRKKVELILFHKNFLNGHDTEDRFLFNLRDHAKRYSCTKTATLADKFKSKYQGHVKKMLDTAKCSTSDKTKNAPQVAIIEEQEILHKINNSPGTKKTLLLSEKYKHAIHALESLTTNVNSTLTEKDFVELKSMAHTPPAVRRGCLSGG